MANNVGGGCSVRHPIYFGKNCKEDYEANIDNEKVTLHIISDVRTHIALPDVIDIKSRSKK